MNESIQQQTDDVRCLDILAPLGAVGEPNTLVDLCEKAMRIINSNVVVRVPASIQQPRHQLISILADAGLKVWIETDEVADNLGIRHTETYVCFEVNR